MNTGMTEILLAVIVIELAVIILQKPSYGKLRDKFMYKIRTRRNK